MRYNKQPELAGQTVIVIGGSSGIGLETARCARADGADVILIARRCVRQQDGVPGLGDPGSRSDV
jgi:NAD(P)-dependent dehydrogenase (short-subunit alcohol dehydrogenase family)